MEFIIFITGIWIAMLPYMKWSKMGDKRTIFHLIVGVYTCISMTLYWINDSLFGYMWIRIAYIMMCCLLLYEIFIKVKGQKAIIDILAIVTSVLGIILSAYIFVLDLNEIGSSIIMVVGSMIILSISFHTVKEEITNKKSIS